MSIKKIVGWLHLWFGLVSGIVVFIVCITGCIWVFNHEISSIGKREKPTIERQDAPYIKPSEMMQRLREQLGRPVGDSTRRPLKEGEYPIVFFGPEELHVYIDEREIWMNPYTGELLDVWEWGGGAYQEFFSFILEGHLELWLPHPYGHYIVRYATLIFLVLLITGLVLWWPKNKAGRKQRFWFRWKKTTKWRRKNYDLHNVPGFWTLLLTFLLAFTGLCIGLEWFSEGVHWVLSGGKGHHHEEEEVPHVEYMSDTTARDLNLMPYTHYDLAGDSVYNIIRETHHGSPDFGFIWPAEHSSTGTFHHWGSHEDGFPMLKIDKYTLEVLHSEVPRSPQELDFAHQVERLYRPIHLGTIWGLPTKILAFMGSLIGASLPITGFYIWWGRKKKGKKKWSKK